MDEWMHSFRQSCGLSRRANTSSSHHYGHYVPFVEMTRLSASRVDRPVFIFPGQYCRIWESSFRLCHPQGSQSVDASISRGHLGSNCQEGREPREGQRDREVLGVHLHEDRCGEDRAEGQHSLRLEDVRRLQSLVHGGDVVDVPPLRARVESPSEDAASAAQAVHT